MNQADEVYIKKIEMDNARLEQQLAKADAVIDAYLDFNDRHNDYCDTVWGCGHARECDCGYEAAMAYKKEREK